MEETVFIMVIIMLAGFVQGASGFGFGLVAISLLASFVEIKEASVVLVFSGLSMNVFIFLHLRSHFKADRVMPLIFSAVLGVPFGVWILVYADAVLLKHLLGVILLLTVAKSFVPKLAHKRWHPLFIGIPCGLFSGGLSGAFSTGGPPLVAYVTTQEFDRFRYSATLQLVLGICAFVRVLCLGAGGVFTVKTFTLSAFSIVFAVAGAWIGLHVLKRLSDRMVKRAILVLLFVLSLKYLIL